MAPNTNLTVLAATAVEVALTGEKINSSVIKHKKFTYKNNQLLLNRKKVLHKKKLNYTESRIRRAKQMTEIYFAYSEKKLSLQERDKCIKVLIIRY